MKAVWKNKVIAESENTLQLEGNYYFPVDSVKKEFLEDSHSKTACYWKGTANYYNLRVDDDVNRDAAWYYKDPSFAAENIKDHIAFWRGVEIIA